MLTAGGSSMAGFIVACERCGTGEGNGGRVTAGDLRACAALISPDDIAPREPVLWEGDGVATAVVNPGARTAVHEGSLAVGCLYEAGEPWWKLGAPAPDGAFALCRVGDGGVELVSDLYASRTPWYVLTDTLFLASSSQRALVALLGSFVLNEEAMPWLLSSGYMPPSAGWDRRIKPLAPASRLTLDRRRWTLEEVREPVPFLPVEGDEHTHIERLRLAILDACARLDVPWDAWRLALSGGIDSRLILMGLTAAGHRPACITWGRVAARRDHRNDAVIGELLAARMGVPHMFLPTDFTNEPLESAVGRFVAVSDGRTCSLGAYADGLRMWSELVEGGVEGVIRGDEPSQGYRWHYVSEDACRLRATALMVSDYPPSHPLHRLGLAPQAWPRDLCRRPGESLNAYGGRLFQDYWSPAMLSPLNDLKGLYLEVANPLLSRSVVVASHSLPESLRRGRRAMRSVHASMKVGLPLAAHSALVGGQAYLARPAFVAELRRGLSLPAAEQLFSDEGRAVLDGLTGESPAPASRWSGVRPVVKQMVPRRAAQRLRPHVHVSLSGNAVAFRAYLAVRAVEMLTADAGRLPERSVALDRVAR